ncbi:MAG TPA: helix-turn-helix domain-containing protein, partial [Ilumatobacteraceae bacterium]|nr:helix-turn-helix domain-containing protein [Ilumatobacteraceae bacterium]
RTTNPERTYGQYCPIAAGLDLIGDRWTLLLLRELSMGDRRFTDLRAALPGIAPNLLTERLRSLQSIGLITAVELPPPAARSVYSLTEEGKRVEPVLRSVARFGAAYLSGEPNETMDAKRAAYALLAPWRRRPEAAIRARLTVAPGEAGGELDDTVDLVLDLDGMRVEAPRDKPDVALRIALRDLVNARQTGAALIGQLTGDPASRHIFLDQFALKMGRLTR